MVAGVPTVEEPSLARISLRSIVPLPILLAGLVSSYLDFSYKLLISPLSAKSLVAAGLARRILVQLSYAIGVAEPLSIYVDSYGTGKKTDAELVEIIRNNWDLRPGVIGKYSFVASLDRSFIDIGYSVRELDLQKPQYLKTASYGHFGNPDYAWEKPRQLKL